jgi:BolA protein
MTTVEVIKSCLASLEPEFLEVEDEGHLHVGHAGAQQGGHFRVKISSSRLTGSRLEQHRTIYALLDVLIIQKKIHALRLDLLNF